MARRRLPRLKIPWLRSPEGVMETMAMGRLPADVVRAGVEDPAPEYIAEAATPSEEVWERVEQRFKDKQGEPPDSDPR